MRYDIEVITEKYIGDTRDKEKCIDGIVIGLARFGYAPFLDDYGNIHFVVGEHSSEEPVDDDSIVAKNML